MKRSRASSRVPRTNQPGEGIMESEEPIIRARDLMERDVITVTPETRLLDVHRLFVEE